MFDLSVLLGKAFESVSARPEIVIILVVALLAPLMKLFVKRKKKHQKSPPPNKVPDAKPYFNGRDTEEQMKAVAKANFQPRPILNKEEHRLLPILDGIVSELGAEHRLIMQASLGELITAHAKTPDAKENARRSINSKRLDFGIIDSAGILKLAVEYQGSGHY